jgi:hypothetical protein
MLASPVPIYLGCAGLIVGSLGLGAQHLLGGNSVSATNATPEQPLFAKSVEEAALPAARWPSQNLEVAYYEPMVELLTSPTRSTHSSAPATVAQHEQENPPVADPREVVRDLPQQQAKPSKRVKNARARNDARARDDATASTEQPDPRDSRAQDRQRTAAQVDAEGREAGSRRFERRSRDREESEAVDIRSRADRRQREAAPRAVVREEMREPEQRFGQGPERRESFGFNPFRLFGAFD